jgi:hypothetical protein
MAVKIKVVQNTSLTTEVTNTCVSRLRKYLNKWVIGVVVHRKFVIWVLSASIVLSPCVIGVFHGRYKSLYSMCKFSVIACKRIFMAAHSYAKLELTLYTILLLLCHCLFLQLCTHQTNEHDKRCFPWQYFKFQSIFTQRKTLSL